MTVLCFLFASLDQTITAVGNQNEKVSNTKPRFVEVISRKKRELKIASILYPKVSRDEDLTRVVERHQKAQWKSISKLDSKLSEFDSVEYKSVYKFLA